MLGKIHALYIYIKKNKKIKKKPTSIFGSTGISKVTNYFFRTQNPTSYRAALSFFF